MFPQPFVLRSHADRTSVHMALAHHHAPQYDQRARSESELLGPEQRGDHHVAAGFQLAVGLQRDFTAQTVQHEGLLYVGQADFGRQAGMFHRADRTGPVPPSPPLTRIISAFALATPAAMVPIPLSETNFTLIRARGLTFFRSKINCARSRSNKYRGAEAARSAKCRGSNAASGRSSRRLCNRGVVRPRRAWPPGRP